MNPPTVLIVSDEPLLEAIVRHLLPGPDHQVARTSDPARAPDLIAEARPRLVLVDVSATDEGALTSLQRLHAHAGLPMIVLANAPEHWRQEVSPSVRLLPRAPEMPALEQALRDALGHPGTSSPEREIASPTNGKRRLVGAVGALLLLLLGAVVLLPVIGVPGVPNVLHKFVGKEEADAEPSPTPAELVKGEPDTFTLPADVVRQMGVPAPHQVGAEPAPRQLTLWGTVAFDPERLTRVQSRFAGEVVAIGESDELQLDGTGKTAQARAINYGSPVRKGQLLAVVWSKELGEKKSELVDALSLLKLQQDTLKRLEELYRQGGTSEAVVRQAQLNVSTSISAVNKAERTLRIWKVADEEINAVKEEAKRVIARNGGREPDREKDWAKVEVRSALDGVVVEKNVVKGHIVDSSNDLFKVADLGKLAVFANIYEEDLRALHQAEARYKPGLIPWRVYLAADPDRKPLPTDGIKRIGLVVDPNQHTDLVMGVVDNPDRRLRVGQFVVAEVDVPAPPDVVSVPTSALDEDGQSSYLLVQHSPGEPRYSLRQVAVVSRTQRTAYVKSWLTAKENAAGLRELRPGEWVVSGGAVQLKAALEEARARARK